MNSAQDVRHAILLFGLVLTLAGCSNGAEPTSQVVFCSPVHPEQTLGFETNLTVDFGTSLVGFENEHTAAISNPGPKTVRITAPEPTFAAGDFSWRIAPADGVLEVGAVARVMVSFVPRAAGAFEKEVILRIQDSATPELKLSLRGRAVASRCSITPDVVDFGELAVGDSAERRIEVTNGSDLDWKVEVISKPGVPFSLEPTIVPHGATIEARLAFHPMAPADHSGHFEVSPTDCSPNTLLLSGSAR